MSQDSKGNIFKPLPIIGSMFCSTGAMQFYLNKCFKLQFKLLLFVYLLVKFWTLSQQLGMKQIAWKGWKKWVFMIACKPI